MDSVCRVEDTCNRVMGIRALSQTAVEEKLKWRQDENDNDGESAVFVTTAKSSSPTSTTAAAAAIFTRNSARHIQNHNVPSLGRNAPADQSPAVFASSPTVVKGKGPAAGLANFYVVLEKSPPRTCNDDSDTSTYDNSFHCRETDICQDSTDYDSSSGGDDSFTTEGIATVDIVEYEVASASDDDDSVNNSSSGTDDHGLVMAAVTTALDTTTSSSDFADSEESDSDRLFDRELTDADYWECIQCKNSHNNPLFRMCEKCYKIRRTHFPPRPRIRRKKLNRRQRLTGSLTETAMEKMRNEESSMPRLDDMAKRLCTSMIGKESFKANFTREGFNSFKKRKLNPNNKSQLNSAAETSDEDLSDFEHRSSNFDGAGHRKRKSPVSRNKRDSLNTIVSSSCQSSLNTNKTIDSSLGRKRKLTTTAESDMQPAKQTRMLDSKNISNMDTETDTDNDTMSNLNNCSNNQKDSGVSSAHSSQEVASSSLSDERSVEKDEYVQQSSKEVSEPLNKAILNGVKSNTDDEKTSTLISETNNPSSLIRSASDCSSTLLNNLSNLGEESFSMNNMSSNLSSYGSCIICLSAPKNGVFVHSRSLHLCSCYKCAVKIWSKYKRCPVCNSSVKNVLKLFVH